MRTLCDAYYEEHESHYRAFLDISVFFVIHIGMLLTKQLLHSFLSLKGKQKPCFSQPVVQARKSYTITFEQYASRIASTVTIHFAYCKYTSSLQENLTKLAIN